MLWLRFLTLSWRKWKSDHSCLFPHHKQRAFSFSPCITKLCACAKLLQSCLTLCDPLDCSPPGSSVHGILQARILELGGHALLQGIFPTHRLNLWLLGPLHWQVSSLWLETPGKSRVTYITLFSSVAQSCLTLWGPMNCSMSGLPVHHQLPEFIQTHVHRVGDAIQPSQPLSSHSPPAPNPSQH